ncbi:MAG: FAD binding domain-containing protein [Acidimicrobiales bacterium]
MKNPPFSYHRPELLDDALDLLAEHEDSIKVLAGGQSLLPILALRLGSPEHILDVGRLPDLDRIDVSADGVVTVGALVRHASAERSAELAAAAPLVHAAMPYVGHRAIRTRGTVVGSIAHADPAAEMPAVALATGATLIARSAGGTREIPAGEFFLGYLETALRPDELLEAVRFPAWPAGATGTVVEVARRHGDYAMVGLACAVGLRDGRIADAALSFLGVGPTPVRASGAEDLLVGQAPSPELFDRAAEAVAAELSPTADGHASANYRRHVAGILTRRALNETTSPAGAAA